MGLIQTNYDSTVASHSTSRPILVCIMSSCFFLNPLAVANSKSFENVSLTQKKKRIVFDKPKKQTNKQNKRSQRPLAWCSWDLWSLALTKNISNVIVTLTWYGTQICNVNKFNTKWQYFVKVNITKAAWRCATNIFKNITHFVYGLTCYYVDVFCCEWMRFVTFHCYDYTVSWTNQTK